MVKQILEGRPFNQILVAIHAGSPFKSPGGFFLTGSSERGGTSCRASKMPVGGQLPPNSRSAAC